MDKEIQNRSWAVLPNEFKEEVKRMYKSEYLSDRGYQPTSVMECLIMLFGEHNLTSDVELLSDISQKEPFKVGDKAVVKQGLGKFEVVKIVYYDAEEKTYRVEFENEDAVGNLWYSFKELEPYTKPQPKNLFSKNVENENYSGDTSQKTPNLRSNLRLQVATAAMQGMWSNLEYIKHLIVELRYSEKKKNMADTNTDIADDIMTIIAYMSVRQADALLAECGMCHKD